MNVISKDLGYGIKSITLNDPKTYNSLSFKTLNELSKLLKKFDADSKTRVIIISGNGKGFSAGHNLKEVKNLKGKDNYQKLFNLCSKLMIQENLSLQMNLKICMMTLELLMVKLFKLFAKRLSELLTHGLYFLIF